MKQNKKTTRSPTTDRHRPDNQLDRTNPDHKGKEEPNFYRNVTLLELGFTATPVPSSPLTLLIPPSTSLQYLSLSSSFCWNLASSAFISGRGRDELELPAEVNRDF